jgi:dipeptidyl aminopeptidase/acylaminoacyl peptidase
MKDYAEAILPGVDRAIELGIADPERLGVMGHSNGGYTVMGLIAQTTRFKAAVSRAGFSDYVSLAFAMGPDGSTYALNIAEDLQLGGSLWNARDRWIDNSPLFGFDRVASATLIVHGAADNAVPAFAADQSFAALRRLGKTVEYARYADEGHSEDVWSRPNRVDYITRMIGWFERFLGADRGR